MNMTGNEKNIEEVGLPGCLAEVMPFESWERLSGESAAAFAAFCFYRDYGPERNIRRAAEVAVLAEDTEAAVDDPAVQKRIGKRYRLWRGWAAVHKWRERAADYDGYVDKLKQAEVRKAIEEQGKADRDLFSKMKVVAGKRLDSMDPSELGVGSLPGWVTTAVRLDRERLGLAAGADKPDERTDKNGQITFIPEFEGL
ncbi:hypothetical protein FACS1894163_09730 [Spirochaetia bacterium]|nr:hypothetical protein FACS1894163_09730 [Spirochaetia bacterium]